MNAPVPMIRLTNQRQIILEELAKVQSHPTANELYAMVLKRLPRVSLGTVYRNLELMAGNNMILKLEVGGTQKRFDAITDPHYHIRCSCCSKVEDMEIQVIENLATKAAENSSFQIQGHHIEFFGVCPDCQQNRKMNTTA